jgi:hypothetical protein
MSDSSLFQFTRHVSQADAEGCGIATLAMIVGDTYEAVKAHVDATELIAQGRQRDWKKEGCTHYTLDHYLGSRGFYISRRYESWGLPMEPFAPIHYASVQQPSNRGHFVCVLANGDVLDPIREGVYKLSDWEKVNQLVGVAPPMTAEHVEVGRAASRFVDAEAEGHAGLIEDAHFGLLRAVTNLRAAA